MFQQVFDAFMRTDMRFKRQLHGGLNLSGRMLRVQA
jgi:hypothetical protein